MAHSQKASLAVIGAGFAGLSAASVLALQGHQVAVYEKNKTPGGRARHFVQDDFMFDMGPSWYWMPDVFEKFYNRFGYTTSDLYSLKKLDPGFKVIFGKDDFIEVPADFGELFLLFEGIEKVSGDKLVKFLREAAYKYEAGMNNLVYKPAASVTEYISLSLMKDVFRLHIFSSFSRYVRSFFKDPKLLALIEFPVLFLGARPQDTPALYSLMNHAELAQGTYYPMGGFAKVVEAFERIAREAGVAIHTQTEVEKVEVSGGACTHVNTAYNKIKVDGVVAAADYHHVEADLLEEKQRSYSADYWKKRTFAPSCLIFYLGLNKKIEKLSHHNLFFDEDFNTHANEIYTSKQWPARPLFYVCCPSKTDETMAPAGCENLFLLMPVSIGLVESDQVIDHYYHILLERLAHFTGEDIHSAVIFKKSYAIKDFENDYHAYNGNAYGLANTLRQTAVLKPRMKSKKVKNLFYAGQLTVPGPGVPPSIISGQIAADQLLKYLNNKI